MRLGRLHHRIQVGARGGQPAAPVDVPVERGEALLAVTVHVVGEFVAGLLHGGEERIEQRVGGWASLEHQRPGVPAERILLVGGQAVLHPLEVGQAVRVVPVGHAGVGRPALVVQRVAALEDHPVDAARPAQDLAPGVVDTPPVHVRLGLALVLPVVEAVADRDGERGGHVDERVPDVVGAACLEHQYPRSGVGGQPIGQCAACGSAADDDEVISMSCHGYLPRFLPCSYPPACPLRPGWRRRGSRARSGSSGGPVLGNARSRSGPAARPRRHR